MKNSVYIVLGMHKSGTTLISQTLHYSGIDMGDFDSSIGYDQGNQYERKETQNLNKEILGCGEKHSISVVNKFNHIDDNSVRKARDVFRCIDEQQKGGWGFKDPRTCLTFDLWQKIAPGAKVIAVFRSPIENWAHYQKRLKIYRIDKKIVVGVKSIRAWCIYNKAMTDGLKKIAPENKIIFLYSDFLYCEKPLKALSSFVDVDLIDMRNSSMHRSKCGKSFFYMISNLICKIVYKKDSDKIFQNLLAEK